ncbi:leukotriene B4 receptor 1 [Amia ocellicauda]|uniref:leukotriene B4 receptor 1 n=1 Tax=Amia ocellicauda TaxID=2972642 RepID=UPI003464D6D4
MKMNGSFSSDGNVTEPGEWAAGRTVASVILGLSFLVGTPGNLLVIWTILRHVQPRSHTVLLILNLAVADLLVLITLPLWIYSLADAWVFGEAACKAMVYVIYACMYSSVFLISTMSVERCVAILYPFALHGWRKEGVMAKVLVVILVLAFIFSIPVILTQRVDVTAGKEECTYRNYTSDSQEISCLVLETSVGFIFPFSILLVCYSQVGRRLKQMTLRNKHRSIALITSVVVAFAVLWFPHHVLNVLSVVSLLLEDSEALDDFLGSAFFLSGALAFISSCINPLLYSFAARRFQSSLKETKLSRLFQDIATNTSQFKGTASSLTSERQNAAELALDTVV